MPPSPVAPSQLDETSRGKLDGIVQQMQANKEPDQNIQAVVDDFKTKYGSATPAAPQTGPGHWNIQAPPGAGLIKSAFQGGVAQAQHGYQQAGTATNPLTKTEAGLEGLAGVANAAFSPLAPLLSPIGAGIKYASDKLSETPLIKGAAGNLVMREGGLADYVPNTAADRIPQDINNIATLLPIAAGGLSPKAVKAETSGVLTKAREAQQTRVATKTDSKIQSIANDWSSPTKSPIASYNNARTILTKTPEIPRFLAEQKIDPNQHIEQGRYSTLDTAQSLRDTAGEMSGDTLRPGLQAADKTVPRTPVADVTKAAIERANEEQHVTANAREQVISNIKKESAALQRKYPNGMSLENMHDEKITYAKNGGYSPIKSASDNNLATGNRSVGSAMGKIVEDKAPKELPVGEFNKYLQKYYKSAEYLDSLNTKKVPVTLGKYISNRAASVAGAVVGHGIGGGILGGVGGYMIGGALEHALENMPNPLRTSFLNNLKVTKPEVYTKVQKYLDTQNQSPTRLSSAVSDQPIPMASKSSSMEMGNYKLGKNEVTKRVEPTGQFRKSGVNFYPNKSSIKPVLSKENQVATAAKTPVLDKSNQVFKGFKDLTTKTLDQLQGRSTVSKQFIEDITNQAGVRQSERDSVRALLAKEGDTVNVKDFANKVKTELLPLKRKGPFGRYESTVLPDELRGPVADYTEHVYNSPIKTSAGDVHYGKEMDAGDYSQKPSDSGGYFAHTRIEDLPAPDAKMTEIQKKNLTSSGASDKEIADFYNRQDAANKSGTTRRVIEVQSDLFQKGRLEMSVGTQGKFADTPSAQKIKTERMANQAKLEPYRNTWHERIIREEVKQAAKDGKTTLQFPTGETAIKIEGLGGTNATRWDLGEAGSGEPMLTAPALKIGQEINDGSDPSWIITDVLGDGKFKAIPKDFEVVVKRPDGTHYPITADKATPDELKELSNSTRAEQFDISNKIDTSSPIYRFYEKEVGKYLINTYGATRVKDPQGVEWYQLDVPKDAAKKPVLALNQSEHRA